MFCLSDDDNFATIEGEKFSKKECHLRISLINIMLGDSILYLITFDIKEKKSNFYTVLSLKDIEGILLTDEHIDDIQERFKEHIKDLSDEDLAIEKEKLCYLIENENQRISSSVNKINIYATIILTVLPLALAIIDLKVILTLHFLLILGIILMIYSLVNICVYVFSAVKVQGINKSAFKDLRESQEKNKEILVQYQYDWQQLRYKAQLFVSYVLNLQEWVILIMILAVGISIGITCQDISKNKIPTNVMKVRNEVITLNIADVEKAHNQEAIKWKELLLEIEKEKCKHIVFVGNYDKVPVFFNELDKYDDVKIDFLQDSQMNKKQIKIIMEEY